jgi:two-component system, NarL family, invasion response regulator UvrY
MKLLLVDDHAIVRAGLRRLLAALPGAELREATNGHDALKLFRAERPDVVVLDINLPDIDGLEVLKRLVAEDGNVRVLVLSMHAEGLYARQCLQLGATGYISKNAQPDEIISAVRQVALGKRYVERHIAQELAILSIENPAVKSVATAELTAREKKLLSLMAQGRTYPEIASEIDVSYRTVTNTIAQIKVKLGVSKTSDLMRLAIKTDMSP